MIQGQNVQNSAVAASSDRGVGTLGKAWICSPSQVPAVGDLPLLVLLAGLQPSSPLKEMVYVFFIFYRLFVCEPFLKS